MEGKLFPNTLLALFVTVFAVGAASCDSRESASPKGSGPGARKIEQLFQDAGVLRIPQPTESIEIRLKDMNGNEVALSDFRRKIVFLNFWATWCPSCRVEMPFMEKLYRRLKDKDFAMVAISLQEPATRVKKFFEEYGLTFTSLLDPTGDVGRGFAVRSIPTTFILDKEGRIIGGAIGAREWDNKKSIALFNYLIENQADLPSQGKNEDRGAGADQKP